MFTISSLLLITDSIAFGLGSLLLQTIHLELCVVAAAAYLLIIPVLIFPHWPCPPYPRHSSLTNAIITTSPPTRSPFNLAAADATDHSTSAAQPVDGLVVIEEEEEEEEEDEDSFERGSRSSSNIRRAVLASGWWHDIKTQMSPALHKWILQPVYPLSFATMFLFTLGGNSDIILQQWTRRAFGWSLLQTTYLLTLNMFISFVAFSILPLLTRRLHGMLTRTQQVDYYLTMISLAIRLLGSLLMSASSKSYTFVPALVLYTLGVGVVDSFRALLSTWTSDQRIVEMFSILTIVGYSSLMLGGVVWPRLFTASADSASWGRGLPYFVSAGCFLCAMVLLVRVWQLLKT